MSPGESDTRSTGGSDVVELPDSPAGQDGLTERFLNRTDVAARLGGIRRDVADGRIPASLAADELLTLAFGSV